MNPPDDLIRIDSAPGDLVRIDGASPSSGRLHAQMQQLIGGIDEGTNLATTGLLKTLTGQGFQDRFLNATSPSIPQSNTAPYDANVSSASNPLNQILSTGRNAVAGMAGSVIDGLTSPLSVGMGMGSVFKSAPTQNILSKINPFGNKIKNDFVDNNIFPQAQKVFSDTIDKFDTPVQEYLMNKPGLKVSQQEVAHIADRSPSMVRQAAGNMTNTDPIVYQIEHDMSQKLSDINKSYDSAYSQLGDKDLIDISGTFKKIRSVLQREGYVDKVGDTTSIAKDAFRNPTLNGLAKEYDFMKSSSGPNTTQAARDSVPAINKYMWMRAKSALTGLYSGDPELKFDVKNVLDQLHSDAEDAGISGITAARDKFVAYLDHVDLAKQFNQSKLDGIFKQPESTLGDLRQLQKYTSGNYEQNAKDIVANQTLNKVAALADAPSLATPKPALYSIIREATQKPETFKQQSKLITDFSGGSKDTLDLLNKIKTLNRNEFIRKSIMGSLGATGGLGIVSALWQGGVKHAAKQVSEATGPE